MGSLEIRVIWRPVVMSKKKKVKHLPANMVSFSWRLQPRPPPMLRRPLSTLHERSTTKFKKAFSTLIMRPMESRLVLNIHQPIPICHLEVKVEVGLEDVVNIFLKNPNDLQNDKMSLPSNPKSFLKIFFWSRTCSSFWIPGFCRIFN